MKDGVKDYNYPGTKLISDSSKKAASDLYEYSYTNNNGDRISEKYTYNPTEDATKISTEPVTQGGEQGDIVQREGTQEGQPKQKQ